ncbi:unnamed protein product [Caenorhabditis angaria]|uniref:DUF38 domain-containing protein n=1 Tax=Caenorhabditis angaria TaxID=860376 RepID=A0A9P1ILP3_9PELO|nr:unnamed protein product [Caenorhabditis angaria]
MSTILSLLLLLLTIFCHTASDQSRRKYDQNTARKLYETILNANDTSELRQIMREPFTTVDCHGANETHEGEDYDNLLTGLIDEHFEKGLSRKFTLVYSKLIDQGIEFMVWRSLKNDEDSILIGFKFIALEKSDGLKIENSTMTCNVFEVEY